MKCLDKIQFKSFDVHGMTSLTRVGEACYTVGTGRDGRSNELIHSDMLLKGISALVKFKCEFDFLGLKYDVSGNSALILDQLRAHIGLDGTPQIVDLRANEPGRWTLDTFNINFPFANIKKDYCMNQLNIVLRHRGKRIIFDNIRVNINEVITKKKKFKGNPNNTQIFELFLH